MFDPSRPKSNEERGGADDLGRNESQVGSR